MNCSNDLWELFPEEEEANNMVRKFFIGRINEHTKHDFSDTDLILYKKIHPVALRFGSNIFRIYLLLLLEKIYVKYFVEIIREPFSSDYISRGSYKFYIRNAVDEIYKPERYHFRHLHRRYLTNLKLTVDTYYDKMKWTLNFFSKYVKNFDLLNALLFYIFGKKIQCPFHFIIISVHSQFQICKISTV